MRIFRHGGSERMRGLRHGHRFWRGCRLKRLFDRRRAWLFRLRRQDDQRRHRFRRGRNPARRRRCVIRRRFGSRQGHHSRWCRLECRPGRRHRFDLRAHRQGMHGIVDLAFRIKPEAGADQRRQGRHTAAPGHRRADPAACGHSLLSRDARQHRRAVRVRLRRCRRRRLGGGWRRHRRRLVFRQQARFYPPRAFLLM
ncbi:hypothetical protein F2P44_13070 [Massilia sp. CCM 8695]|uniref:Uncharacterized protein n=1 Tax=Massilia frigida TaxID=2609281 RepID=A0ABX0N4L5_9BURK|nr:hypothetical protein [Massilia frigida]